MSWRQILTPSSVAAIHTLFRSVSCLDAHLTCIPNRFSPVTFVPDEPLMFSAPAPYTMASLVP